MTQQRGMPHPTKLAMAKTLGLKLLPVHICDIGARREGAYRYAALVQQGLANVSGFESSAKECARLNTQCRPGDRYFPMFIGKGGPAKFHITHFPGCSSLYEPDPSVIDLFLAIGTEMPSGNFAVESTESVQTTRLDDVPGLSPVDYLKLDIQGAELDALQGATKVLTNVLVIEAEVEFVPLYKNQPLFGDVQIFLRSQGFVLHKLIDVAGRCFRPFSLNSNPFAPMSQMLWADAVFIRDFSRLERYSNDQLLQAAMILYEVYNSHDLVQLLLREYDRRCNTRLIDAFRSLLAALPGLPVTYLNQKLTP